MSPSELPTVTNYIPFELMLGDDNYSPHYLLHHLYSFQFRNTKIPLFKKVFKEGFVVLPIYKAHNVVNL